MWLPLRRLKQNTKYLNKSIWGPHASHFTESGLKMQKIWVKFHFLPCLKCAFHCINFHEKHNCLETSHTKSRPDRWRNTDCRGINSFTLVRNVSLTVLIFAELTHVWQLCKDMLQEIPRKSDRQFSRCYSVTGGETDGRTWSPHKANWLR